MKGDFSRLSFDRDQRYSSVRQQQGRVLLDADWNEQQEILEHRIEVGTRDQLGLCAVPSQDDFLTRTLSQDGVSDVAIAPGRLYVGGLVVEQPGTSMPVALGSTTDKLRLLTLVVDSVEVEAGQWLEISAEEAAGQAPKMVRVTAVDKGARELTVAPSLDELQTASQVRARRFTTLRAQSDLPGVTLPENDGLYVAYLDVWRRHVTALEDPGLLEVALGGPDTTTRLKTIWQLKLAEVSRATRCADFPPGWSPEDLSSAPAPAPGQLAARASDTAALENQLYRVEVHQGGDEATATFKWSRDNGVVVANVVAVGTETITFSQPVRDEERQFEAGQWVEVTDDEKVLKGEPGLLVELTGVDDPTLTILSWPTPDGAPPEIDPAKRPIVRAWSNAGEVQVRAGSWIPLEDGVEVQFQAGRFKNGDYWVIPARRDVNNVLWRVDSEGRAVPRLPEGITHHYCPLALLNRSGGAWSVDSDCRRVVPSLSTISDAKVNRSGDTMTGKLTLEEVLEVKGNTALRSNVTIGGNTTLENPLTAKQPATFEKAVSFRDTLNADSNLQVGGNAGVTGSLGVGGELESTGKLTALGEMNVKGAATLESGLTVQGSETVEGELTVHQKTRLKQGLEVEGEVSSRVGDTDYFMVPRGGIIMWSGALNQVPTGWLLCNGQNGTPDLRDRFVVGAGQGYNVADVGGASQVTLGIHQMPSHNHLYQDTYFAEYWGYTPLPYNRGSNGGMDYDNRGFEMYRYTHAQGGNQPHENRPPYFALAFIMKA